MTTDDELIEQAARVLFCLDGDWCSPDEAFTNPTVNYWFACTSSDYGEDLDCWHHCEELRKTARALLPLFHRVREEGIEEAAGVAQSFSASARSSLSEAEPVSELARAAVQGNIAAALSIAKAILALKEQSSGEG